ncbi:MAG TPA: carboxylesterase family protein [Steroidobacteraceae bacterium]
MALHSFLARASLWLAFVAAAGAASGASETGQVRVRTGLLQGVVDASSQVTAFKGIPYAKPPIGELRWRPPVPEPVWEGVREAREFGHACLQPPSQPTSVYYAGIASMSEDCLTLNVWAPAGARQLPVMVWIHGGSLVGGSGSEPMYDGVKIAQQGIVFVSINYRLGLLGYLAHPALSAESPQHLSGNYGLLDQIEALRWVQDNIAVFGGNAQEVTVAGESAGGLSVIALLTSPLAHGLFAKAIVESGYMPSYRLLHEEGYGLPSAEAAGAALATTAGVSDAAALRAADLVALFQAGLKTGWQPEPVIDGVVLKRQFVETFTHGEQAKVPVLAGFNEGEIRSLLFLMPKAPDSQAAYEADVRRRFGAKAAEFLAVYPAADPRASVMASMRDGLYGFAAQYLVRQQAAAGQPAYLYFFRHGTPTERARDLAAFHASELPYIFGRLSALPTIAPNWPLPPSTTAESRLSQAMMSYWTSFVRDGIPKAAGAPPWPRFTAQHRGYLDIDDRPYARQDLLPGAFAFADELVSGRVRQGRGWRLDIGYSAFSVDAPVVGRQPTPDEQHR